MGLKHLLPIKFYRFKFIKYLLCLPTFLGASLCIEGVMSHSQPYLWRPVWFGKGRIVHRNADEARFPYNITWMPLFLLFTSLEKDIYLAFTCRLRTSHSLRLFLTTHTHTHTLTHSHTHTHTLMTFMTYLLGGGWLTLKIYSRSSV